MSDDRTEEIKQNILSPSQWTRILFMVFYAVACWVLTIVLSFIIVAQILVSLITGTDNENLRTLGHKLAGYFHDALEFLVYASNDKPWPFNDVDNDDDDDDDDSPVYRKPANDPEPGPAPSTGHSPDAGNTSRAESSGADDVFADISFTDSSHEADEDTEATNHSVDFTDGTRASADDTSDHDKDGQS